jgi:hypothetical protein
MAMTTESELQSPQFAPDLDSSPKRGAPPRPPLAPSFLRKVFAPPKAPAVAAVAASAVAAAAPPPAPVTVPDPSAAAFETGKTVWQVATELFGGDKDAAAWLLVIGVVGLTGYGIYRFATRDKRRRAREAAIAAAEEARARETEAAAAKEAETAIAEAQLHAVENGMVA